MPLYSYLQFCNFLAEQTTENAEHKFDALYEGGAYGHLQHPFEDIELTFLDLKDKDSLAPHQNLKKNQALLWPCEFQTVIGQKISNFHSSTERRHLQT